MEKIYKTGIKIILSINLITENINASLIEAISKTDFIRKINKLYNNQYKNFSNWDIAGKHFYINTKKGIYYNLKILEKVLFYDIRLSFFLEKNPKLTKKNNLKQ